MIRSDIEKNWVFLEEKITDNPICCFQFSLQNFVLFTLFQMGFGDKGGKMGVGNEMISEGFIVIFFFIHKDNPICCFQFSLQKISLCKQTLESYLLCPRNSNSN